MARKRNPGTVETEDDPVGVADESTAALRDAAEARTEGPAPDSGSVAGLELGEFGSGDAIVGSAADQGAAALEELAGSDDGEGLEGSLDEDDVDSAKQAREWLFGSGSDGALRDAVGVTGPGGSSGGGGGDGWGSDGRHLDPGDVPPLNPLAGTDNTSPLTSGADAINAITGRNTVSDGSEAESAPAFGQGMISKGYELKYKTKFDEGGHKFEVATLGAGKEKVTVVRETFTRMSGDTVTKEVTVSILEVPGSNTLTVTSNATTGVITTTEKIIYDNGATQTTTTVDRPGAKPTTTTTTTPPPKDSNAGDPGPDGEGAPIPEDLQHQLDADMARLRALQNQGPDSGDGATDPSEIESEMGPVTEALDDAAFGKGLIVNPGTADVVGGGGPPAANPGGDSQGAGVITPGEDQEMRIGAGRNDSPFDGAELEIEAAADADDDEGAASLVRSEIASPVDGSSEEIPDDMFFGPA